MIRYIASCSCGKDSVAMVLTLIEKEYPLDRVSCYCCGNKNLKELKAIYQYLPEYWQKLRDMQDKTAIPFRDHESIYDLEERFKKE